MIGTYLIYKHFYKSIDSLTDRMRKLIFFLDTFLKWWLDREKEGKNEEFKMLSSM